MLDAINHMTDKEKKELREDIEQMSEDAKIDQDAIIEAMSEGNIFINDLIHIQQMKNELCRNIGIKPMAFGKDDFIRICSKSKEEDKRKELSVVVTEKLRDMSEADLNNAIVDMDKAMEVIKKVNALHRKQKKEPFLPGIKEADEANNIVGGISVDRLRSLIERIERLEEEKKAISSDIADIYAEAKSAGFDPKIMRTVIKIRKMPASDRDEQETLLDTYKRALDL